MKKIVSIISIFAIILSATQFVLADYSDDEKEKVVIYFDRISHFEVANVDKQWKEKIELK